MGNSKEHYGSHKKKNRPECNISILHVLNSLLPDLFAKRNCRNLKSKTKSHKTELVYHPGKKFKI